MAPGVQSRASGTVVTGTLITSPLTGYVTVGAQGTIAGGYAAQASSGDTTLMLSGFSATAASGDAAMPAQTGRSAYAAAGDTAIPGQTGQTAQTQSGDTGPTHT